MTTKEDGERTKPFMQRVQLAGNATVRATGQVDDGAMVNCLSKAKWNAYNVCLWTLLPLTTIIGVANNQRVRSMGRWKGTIRVGGIVTESTFEVFECQGAFEVILGKPWLRQVKATHEYMTDTIRIPTTERTITLTNEDTNTQAAETPASMSTIKPTRANPTEKPQPNRNRWEALTVMDTEDDETDDGIEVVTETHIRRSKKQEHRWKAQLDRWREARKLRKDLRTLEQALLEDAI